MNNLAKKPETLSPARLALQSAIHAHKEAQERVAKALHEFHQHMLARRGRHGR